MRVLIMSVATGGGHKASAQAIKNAVEKRGGICSIADPFSFLNPVVDENIINKGYLASVSLTPKNYARIYNGLEKSEKYEQVTQAVDRLSHILSKPMLDYILAFDPDFIVSTHVVAALTIDAIKKTGKIDVPCAGVVTDFTIHPFWPEVMGLDYLIVPSEELIYHAVNRGIPRRKIVASGIPVNEKFSVRHTKKEASEMLGLSPDSKRVLFMSGSMGYGNMDLIIEQLNRIPDDFELVVICGSNVRVKRRAERARFKNRKYVYGFVNNVDIFMDASDIIITKPGGLTTSELLCKEIPLVITNPIPGQEDRNREFLLNCGVGLSASATFPVDAAVYQLMHDDERRQQIIENMKKIGKKNAAGDLCDIIWQYER